MLSLASHYVSLHRKQFSACFSVLMIKGKVKVHPRTDREGPLISALMGWAGNATPLPLYSRE